MPMRDASGIWMWSEVRCGNASALSRPRPRTARHARQCGSAAAQSPARADHPRATRELTYRAGQCSADSDGVAFLSAWVS